MLIEEEDQKHIYKKLSTPPSVPRFKQGNWHTYIPRAHYVWKIQAFEPVLILHKFASFVARNGPIRNVSWSAHLENKAAAGMARFNEPRPIYPGH